MNQIHPGEERIQQFVLEKLSIDLETVNHILKCKICKERVQAYEKLFSGIKEQTVPVFDFDLEQSVLAQLPKPAVKYSEDKNLVLAIIGCSLIFIIGAGFLMNEYLPGIIEGTNTILVYLILTTIAIVCIFQVTEIVNNYQKKIKTLKKALLGPLA